MITIKFEDDGQDFLEWDVDNGEVIACRPLQGWVWVGLSVMEDALHVGCPVPIVTKDGRKTVTKHLIKELVENGQSCTGCRYHKGMSNKARGVRIPGGYGKCIRPEGHCSPSKPNKGF